MAAPLLLNPEVSGDEKRSGSFSGGGAPFLLHPEILSAGLGAIGSFGSSLLNGLFNRSSMAAQVAHAKDLMKYQWENFQSPQAQVKALAAAGINPAVALGQGGSGFTASPSVNMPSSTPPQIGGVLDIASFVKAMAEAKKANVDVKNIEVDILSKKFELELSRVWSNPEKIVNLVQSWKNVMLSNDAHSLNEWKIASEKALAGLKGIERDTAKKLLDNMDIQIEQENRQREEGIKLTKEKQTTEQTAQSANIASANASNTQADVNRATRRLQSALADIEETGKTYKIESLISEYQKNKSISDVDAKEANIKLARLRELEYKRDSSLFSEIDNFLEWIKGKVSIFH